jgi:enoyl-CoA hydratase
MPEPELIVTERPAPRVARLVLNRPEKRNAQNTALLHQLDRAFHREADNDDVSVIILAAAGPHFSAGHDLGEADVLEQSAARPSVTGWRAGTGSPVERIMARERDLYLGMSERWRVIPKPTIAQVHGKCIAGGLMLVWPCDLIVASDDAEFQDPTVLMGMPGCELFVHPAEVGPRQAKEWLFTASTLTASQALQLGMVNRVVPRAALESETLSLASAIASKPLAALRLVKESVNAAADAQGRSAALQVAFANHQIAHAHNLQLHGIVVDPAGISPRVSRP